MHRHCHLVVTHSQGMSTITSERGGAVFKRVIKASNIIITFRSLLNGHIEQISKCIFKFVFVVRK